jgi:hypothetical protein
MGRVEGPQRIQRNLPATRRYRQFTLQILCYRRQYVTIWSPVRALYVLYT